MPRRVKGETMNEQEMQKMMYNTVDIATQELTDLELAVLFNVASLDADPHGKVFDYDKVKGLFTEGGIRMHQVTKDALAVVVSQRLA